MASSKVLPKNECAKYFMIRDVLAMYANEYFELGLELFDAKGLRIDEDFREALDNTWADMSVIDNLLIDGEGKLSRDECETLRSWKSALTTYFVVFEHKGHVYFKTDDYLFDVCGLSSSIASMIGDELPQMISTTLLPFKDRVVYDGNLVFMPVQMGPGMLKMIDEEIADALANAERVDSGQRLVELSGAIKEAEIQHEAQRMIEETELDLRANEQLPGHHTGVLAGLDDAARKAAVKKHAQERFDERQLSSRDFNPIALLRKDCRKGSPKRTLLDCMMLDTKSKFSKMAQALGVKYFEKKRKAKVIEELHGIVLEDPILFQGALENLSARQLENTKKLWEAGGMMRVAKEGLTSLADLPPALFMVTYIFEETDAFVFVMPDEVRDLLTDTDWEDAAEWIEKEQQALDVTEALIVMRGAVPLTEAYEEYLDCYPDGIRGGDFGSLINDRVADEYLGCDILLDEDGVLWLLDYDLAWAWNRDHGIDEDDDFYFHAGDYGKTMQMFLDMREGKDPRPLPQGVRSYQELRDWLEALPAVRAFRDYLDAHVPDDADDYFFADAVIEDLLDYMKSGLTGGNAVQTYLEILQDAGYVPDEAHLRKIIDMLMHMANAVPVWANYGWAPNELHEQVTG